MDNDQRLCWICLSTDQETDRRDWRRPCRCRDTNKWVHESCLFRWIDEKQQANPNVTVTCPQCHIEYIIVTPGSACRFDALLENVDRMYGLLCDSILFGMMLTVIYLSLLSYGVVTLIQVLGHETSAKLIREDPKLLMIMLPSMPAALLMLRRLDWDSRLVYWLRRRQSQSIQSSEEQVDEHNEPLPGAPLTDDYFDMLESLSLDADDMLQAGVLNSDNIEFATYHLCAALCLPTFAIIIGQTLYGNLYGKLFSIAMGAITFEVIKGLTCVYLRQCLYYRLRHRTVSNHIP